MEKDSIKTIENYQKREIENFFKSNDSVIIHPIVEPKHSFEQLVDAILCNTNMTVAEAKEFVNNINNPKIVI